jgi:hypothetical protein
MGEPEPHGIRYLSQFKQTETTELEEVKQEVETMLDEEMKAEIMAMIKEALAAQAPAEEPPKEMADGEMPPETPVEDVKAVAEETAKEVVTEEIKPLEDKVAVLETKVAELSKKPAAERTLSKPVEDTSERIVMRSVKIRNGEITGVN